MILETEKQHIYLLLEVTLQKLPLSIDFIDFIDLQCSICREKIRKEQFKKTCFLA